MFHDTPIVAETTVDQLFDAYPHEAIPLFIQHNMACIGCPLGNFHTLADIAVVYKMSLPAFLADLRVAVANASSDQNPA